ncbi:hypothetical protein B0H34DRAFT_834971 [Crassisporium funariophilum]|nr:hypothetical protein B0H34DRAFT_834971 [Crassisporium funariophilum]
MLKAATLLGASLWLGAANAHLAAWHKGMYCINDVNRSRTKLPHHQGNQGGSDLNSYSIVSPLYQLSFNDWWLRQLSPPDGDFIDLPAGGSFTIEVGSNRAKTSLAYNGRDMSDWPDGETYPEDYNVPSCIIHPNMHAQNRSMAAGTAFAISYQSDIKQVKPDNLVVFSVRYHTPWKRVTSYDVPAAMPPCPPGGCICAWGWVPNGCGQPNMYHQPFKCRVSGSTSNTAIAAPKPPVWCEGNPGACTKGAKQMIYWNQNEGNNIQVDGYDQSGSFKSPGYNGKLGFNEGAQNDIFAGAPSSGNYNPGNSGNSNNPGNSNTGNSNAGNSNPAPPGGSGGGNNLPTRSTDSSADSGPTDTPATTGLKAASIPNNAPSCKKKRRRSMAAADTSLVKKSVLAEGVTSHRRSTRRGTGRDPVW